MQRAPLGWWLMSKLVAMLLVLLSSAAAAGPPSRTMWVQDERGVTVVVIHPTDVEWTGDRDEATRVFWRSLQRSYGGCAVEITDGDRPTLRAWRDGRMEWRHAGMTPRWDAFWSAAAATRAAVCEGR